jgi:two-component system cell cycle sensor histidine kinase PleC
MAVLGHELRTPLNTVLGYADAMQCEVFGPLPAPYRDQAASIHAAASHLLALVEAMTALGAAETGARPLDMRRLDGEALQNTIADAVALFSARAAASTVEIRAPAARSALVDAWIDPLALSQILVNLIDNAMRFTRPGGVVAIVVERDGDHVRLTVENGGGGGAAPGGLGSGLGLRLACALAEAMGGSLELDVSSDGHALAVVRFPALMED